MKHLIFTLFLTTCLCMKKGGSFTRMMDINTQSLKNLDQPVYSLNERQRAQELEQKNRNGHQNHESQNFDNQHVQQALINDANNQLRQNDMPQFVNIVSSQEKPIVVFSPNQMEQNIGAPCLENDTLIKDSIELQVLKNEGDAQIKRMFFNNKLRTFKIFKYNYSDNKFNQQIGQEILRLHQVQDISNSSFIQYKQCYYGSYKKDYYIALEQENYAHALNYIQRYNYTNGYLFFQNVPKIERIKMYRDILFSLEQIHQQGLVHRNIKPSNLVSKLGLEQYDITKKTNYAIIITDMNIMQNAEQHGKINGSLKYLHPHLFIGEQRIIGDYLDIYALALSLIEISTYKKNQFDSISFFGDYLKDLNDYKKKPKEELTNYYFEQFSTLKNRIQQMIGLTEEQVEAIKIALAECTEKSNPEQHFNGSMRSICKDNIECVFFSALNFNINYIPDALFYKETMNSLISNLRNKILI